MTAGEDDSVHLYNINSGTVEKTVFSRKYGVSHIRFTHHPQSVVYASNKVRDLKQPAEAPVLCSSGASVQSWSTLWSRCLDVLTMTLGACTCCAGQRPCAAVPLAA